VSLPAQVAAVKALQDPDYYAERYRETHELRHELSGQLQCLGWEPVPSIGNFILCNLPEDGPTAAAVTLRCREKGLFLRDASGMGTRIGPRALRIAVKDRETNQRMMEILKKVCKQQ
jgi:histidinol-phosphate/aromatic aminotransferase/cobyric acid decarboxylase-like protein